MTSKIVTTRRSDQSRINQYQFLAKCGHGVFGEVYKATDDSGNEFAIKIIPRNKLRSNPESKAKMNEIEVLKDLHHPNIVHLCEVVDDPFYPQLYLVFKFLPGSTLQDRV